MIRQEQTGTGLYDPEVIGQLKNKIADPIKSIDRCSFGWGVSAAVIGLLFLPSLGKSMRGFARKAMEETMDITDRFQGIFTQVKEEFEDIVAEANFNRLKDTVSKYTEMVGEKEPPSNE